MMLQYFDKQRGFAMGMVTTGNSVGGMVYPIVVRQLMPKVRRHACFPPPVEGSTQVKVIDILSARLRLDNQSPWVHQPWCSHRVCFFHAAPTAS